MCFSASASFIAGSALSAAGVVTLTKAKKKKEIPLALIPLLFGIQQLLEGLVWISLRNGLSLLNSISSYSFIFFAHVLWPIYVPIAVLLVETVAWRKKMIMTCGALGAAAGAYLFAVFIMYPTSSVIVNHSIQYICPSPRVPLSLHAVCYIIATCGATLLSSHKMIRLLGICTAVFLAISYYFYTATFASVWCFFSAVLSIILYFHFSPWKKNSL